MNFFGLVALYLAAVGSAAALVVLGVLSAPLLLLGIG
jgi:hypothetical protein